MIDNILIIIDPGHGGNELGAVENGIKEKDINLQLANKVVPLLKEFFSNVIQTRTTDTYFEIDARASWVAEKAANFAGKTICLSLHFNAFDRQACGTEAIYSIYSDDALAKAIVKKIVELGISYRNVYNRAGTYDKAKDYFAMHRLSGKAQTVIVESLFIDNSGDVAILRQDGFFDRLAEKIVAGLMDYVQPASVPQPEPQSAPTPETPKENVFKKDNDELLAAGILHNDHTADLDKEATIGFVCALVNRVRKEK